MAIQTTRIKGGFSNRLNDFLRECERNERTGTLRWSQLWGYPPFSGKCCRSKINTAVLSGPHPPVRVYDIFPRLGPNAVTRQHYGGVMPECTALPVCSRPPMLPIDDCNRALIYVGINKDDRGKDRYLAIRQVTPPAGRFPFPQSVNTDYGWPWPCYGCLTAQGLRFPHKEEIEIPRQTKFFRTFYRRRGMHPDYDREYIYRRDARIRHMPWAERF